MANSTNKKRRLRRNVRPSIVLLLLPISVGIVTLFLIGTGLYIRNLSNIGSDRLVTENWQSAQASLLKTEPDYGPKFAYYKVKPGQTLESLAAFYSVDIAKLQALNPGTIVPGTTIKIPPVQSPLQPVSGPNGLIGQATVTTDAGGMMRVTNKYGTAAQIVTTIPDLMQFLKPYDAIQQLGDKEYMINKAFSLDDNIRLDVTSDTVTKLLLRSSPKDVTCLCMDGGSMLVKGVDIQSYDPATKQPDATYADGRSFVRMRNGRMDVLNSNMSYLGNALDTSNDASIRPSLKEGGTYGTSWRIASDTLGTNIVTGWVEGSTFSKSHFGAFTFGASGIMWKSNVFSDNEVYGLDPHDDSNNATIENNVFANNKKHGFIVSKRCNYNTIKDNISYDNGFHGFMLHADSAYNVIENNISYGNTDNFVIYGSNYDTIRNNVSYNPRSSHIRINEPSYNNFVIDNKLYGGNRGVYVYDGVANTYVGGNTILGVKKVLQSSGSSNTFFGDNTVAAITYDIPAKDRFVFGLNTVKASDYPTIDPVVEAKKILKK